MKSKFTWIFTLFMAFFIQLTFAQEKTVSGVVTDGTGMPVPGATVMVESQPPGVQTDFDGKYSIKVAAGKKLVFSFMGMKTVVKEVGASSTVSVVLQDDIKDLDEVVVGYTRTSKEAYVGTATKVKAENIQNKSISNITQALKGEVAGVNVITTSGQPGSDATIRIRGFGSVNGNRDPLYVLDGVPYQGDKTAINPADVESMTILKDATATAVYGSRGANGVVLITTKSGKAGKSNVSVDLRTSLNMRVLPTYSVIKSPEEYIGLAWESMYNAGVNNQAADPVAYANSNLFGGLGISSGYNMWNVTDGSQLIDPATRSVRAGVTRKYSPENWSDYAYQTSYRQEANVTMSGGNEKTTYASTFGFLDDQGYIVNSDYRRYSTRLNLTHKPAEWLKATANIGYSGSRYTMNGQSSDSGSIFWFADNIPSIYPLFLRDASGNKVADPIYGGYRYDYGDGTSGSRGFAGLTNAIADAHYDKNRTYQHNFNGNFGFDAKIYKGITFETRYGAQFEDGDNNNRNNPFYGSSASTFGSLTKERTRDINQNFLQLLRYSHTFGEKHSVEAFAAHESTDRSYNSFSATKTNAILYNTFDLDQYTTSAGKASSYTYNWTLESYFGQASYNYDQKYFFTGSIRRDGSSRFKYNKWGTFGSVGASWIISKEKFMEKLSFINFLKVKGSWGVIGDQGTRLMNGWQIYSIGNTDDYSFTMSTEQANANLTWETSKITQFGLESSFFKNRLDVNVDYYVKNTDNLLFSQTLPPSTGNINMYVNDGELRNQGLEYDVLAHIVRPNSAEGFMLDFGINGEVLKNKLVRMPIDPATNKEKVLDGSYSKGHSIYDFYMREWAGVDPANGNALWYMYYDDLNGDGIYDTGDTRISSMTQYLADNPDAVVKKTTTSTYANATQKYVGKTSIPKVRGAFRVNASYMNFDLTAQFSYSLGGYVYDNTYAGLMGNDQIGTNNWSTDIRNRWQQPGDITNVPKLSNATDANVNSTSTRFLTKADYFSLNNVKIGYTIPKRYSESIGLSRCNIYVSGDNLMFFSHRNGLNPSTSESGSSNTYRYMPLSTFTTGVRLEF